LDFRRIFCLLDSGVLPEKMLFHWKKQSQAMWDESTVLSKKGNFHEDENLILILTFSPQNRLTVHLFFDEKAQALEHHNA